MSKKVSQAELRKLMREKQSVKKKPTKRVGNSGPVSTEDIIALKKIKLLQEHGKIRSQNKKSNLASKLNYNADKFNAKAGKLSKQEDEERVMPAGFFDDANEARSKLANIETTNSGQPMEVDDSKEKINKRLLNQRKDGPKVKGIGIAKELPAGFYDDATKDAKIRGVETPADKEKREWNEFNEAMNEEVVKSNQMLEEEDEHGNLARDISEVDHQIELFNKTKGLADKAASLREMREKLRKRQLEDKDISDSDEDSDEEIDWRQQNIF